VHALIEVVGVTISVGMLGAAGIGLANLLWACWAER
jgi:hypothetical protein